MRNLKVGVISLTAGQDVTQNIHQALHMVSQAAAQGCEWIVLPEVFSYQGPYSGLYAAADEPRGSLYQRLAQAARELEIVLFAGSYAERHPEPSGQKSDILQRVANTMYVFARDGCELACYRKTHLFNLRDANGKALYCESEGYIAGSELTRFSCDGYEVALAICYDLRFPGMFERLIKERPVDVLVIPAAFTKQTGGAHWHLLNRARAVDYQCFVLAANQVGLHERDKSSYGHSLICDPWGDVLADTGESSGVATAEISGARLQQVRERLPVMANRRQELY